MHSNEKQTKTSDRYQQVYRHNRSVSINVQGNQHYANYSIDNLKIESQLRKVKKYIAAQKQLQRTKVMMAKIQKQLQEYEQKTKVHKKQLFARKIQQIRKRNKQRQKINKKTNSQLAQINEMRQQMKIQMEQKIFHQKKEFQKCYSQALQNRKKIMKPINFQALKQHQKEYVRKYQHLKPEYCIYKSPNGNQSSRTKIGNKSHSSQKKSVTSVINNEQQERKRKAIDMIHRRNQYGNKMQIQKRYARVKTEVTAAEKQKIHTQKFTHMLDRQRQLNKFKKAPLVNRVDWQQGSLDQIKLIKKRSRASPTDKIIRLNQLSEGYRLKYENGKLQALNLMSEATLAKADLFLNSFQ